MTILATDILTLLSKAERLGANYDIKQQDDGFEIQIYYVWHKDDYYRRSVFITNENEGTWDKGDYPFDAMMDVLDEELEEQKQKEIKAQKRKELIARLTDEEKELLDLK
jgi:hypothetical protein